MLNPEKKAQWEMEQRAEAHSQRAQSRTKRGSPNQPPPDAGEEEMRQFWRDFEKIFQDMDKTKRSKGYQRVKVEFKRPFRGSEFAWTYEEEQASPPRDRQQQQQQQQQQRSRSKASQTVNDFFSSVFESFFSDNMPRAEVRPMRREGRRHAQTGQKGPRRERSRWLRKRYR